jgi:hypothetical protein
MPEGVIFGGWSYVIAAYSITGLGLALFAWSLYRRERAEEERSRDNGQ